MRPVYVCRSLPDALYLDCARVDSPKREFVHQGKLVFSRVSSVVCAGFAILVVLIKNPRFAQNVGTRFPRS